MIQSIIKAMDIINILASENRKFTITEISQKLNMPPSTVHRILKTLNSQNFVSQTPNEKSYYLGSAFVDFGKKAVVFLSVSELAKFELKRLTMETHEDSFLVVKSGYKGVVSVEELSLSHKTRTATVKELDLHLGAIRRCLLAYQDSEFINEYISNGLYKMSEYSIVQPNKLLKSLEEIRRRGYCVSFAEYAENDYGVGAPVFDINNKIVASIGLVISETRINKNNEKKIIDEVLQSSKKLSKNLGWED